MSLPELPAPWSSANTVVCAACGAPYKPRSPTAMCIGSGFRPMTHACACGNTSFKGTIGYDSPSPARYTADQMREYATLSLQEAERRITQMDQASDEVHDFWQADKDRAEAAERRAEEAEADARRLRETLAELVELENLEYRIDNWDTDSGRRSEVLAMMNDHARRQPIAWKAARAALAAEHRAALPPSGATAETGEVE